MKRILTAFALVFGMHFLGKWYSRRSADIVTGTVVDVKTTTLAGGVGRGGTHFHYPIVRYELRENAYTTGEVSGAIYTRRDVRVGDSIQIVVSSGKPTEAVPDAFWCYWLRLPKAIFLFFGAVLLSILFLKTGDSLLENEAMIEEEA